MSAREPGGTHSNSDHVDFGHSDLGPSSKDWLPGSTGRDEDFTPEKDLWTKAHKGDLGEGRPGEDIHTSKEGSAGPGGDVQPGTRSPGKSWQSTRPKSSDPDEQLEEELEDTFPASDPPSVTQPGATGWDVGGERDSGRSMGSGTSRYGEESWGEVRTAIPGWVWFAVGLALVPVVLAATRGSRPERRSPRRPF